MSSDETKSLTDEVKQECTGRTDEFHPTDEVGGSYMLVIENHNSGRSMPQKNALMFLHDVRPDLEFRLISKTGPSHSPTFTIAVEVNGTLFIGQDKKKKQAKLHAAHKLLTSILQFTDTPEVSGCLKSNEDFTTDNIDSSLYTSFSINALSHADEIVREEGKNCGMSLIASKDSVGSITAEYATPVTTDVGTQTEERESDTATKKKGRRLNIWKRLCAFFTDCFARKRKN